MKVQEAREIAREWVQTDVSSTPGLHSVFFAGSINFMGDDDSFPHLSDVDLFYVLKDEAGAEQRHQKKMYRGVLLDQSYHRLRHLQNVEGVLGHFVYACNLAVPSILHDPTGQLTRIHRLVSVQYEERKWVRKRCENLRRRVLESYIVSGRKLRFSHSFC